MKKKRAAKLWWFQYTRKNAEAAAFERMYQYMERYRWIW